MHCKNSALLPPKGQNSQYDPHGLHGAVGPSNGSHKQNASTIAANQSTSENHYLPNISPNYTSAANNNQNNNNAMVSSAMHQNSSSSRTLTTSIPHIASKQ